MTRTRRRWLVACGASLAAVLLLVTLVLYTNVGAPSNRYTSMPDPCHLLHEPTVRELAGVVPLSPTFDSGPGRTGRGLTRDTAVRTCHGSSAEVTRGSVDVSVLLFYSPQFHLGRTGEQQAVDQLVIQNELLRDYRYQAGCSYELHVDRGSACGLSDEQGLDVHIQRANIFVSISLSFQGSFREDPDPRPDELMAVLVEEVLSQLDDAS